jgi:hypothetical protein
MATFASARGNRLNDHFSKETADTSSPLQGRIRGCIPIFSPRSHEGTKIAETLPITTITFRNKASCPSCLRGEKSRHFIRTGAAVDPPRPARRVKAIRPRIGIAALEFAAKPVSVSRGIACCSTPPHMSIREDPSLER